jgi:RNA polymerase sigma-70 factor (ECF subfamily)
MDMGAMSGTVEQDLTGLVASAAGGDEVAFARIVAEHHEDMRRVCAFVARDEAIAEDAVQVAWTIVWRKLGSLRDPECLRAWLVSVAVNETRRLLRKRGRHPEVEWEGATTGTPVGEAAELLAGDDPATRVGSIDLQVAMSRLDPDERALLAMRYGAGFNATELSVALGLSPSGTRNRLERLLARLRQELG